MIDGNVRWHGRTGVERARRAYRVFANGRRHHGAFDLASLTALVRSALAQART